MKVKEKDFIEIEYTGRITDGNIVFDTTDEKTAKENDLHNDNVKYLPIKICVGEGHVLLGLEKELIGKDIPGTYNLSLSPEKAFGKKDAKLIRLIPRATFKKQNVEPVPRLQVNIDGVFGHILNVTGGRVIVDFNHPLASRTVNYEVKITRMIEDSLEKLKVVVQNAIGLSDESAKISLADGKAEIILPAELPKKVEEELAKKIRELVGISEILITIQKEAQSEENGQKESQ